MRKLTSMLIMTGLMVLVATECYSISIGEAPAPIYKPGVFAGNTGIYMGEHNQIITLKINTSKLSKSKGGTFAVNQGSNRPTGQLLHMTNAEKKSITTVDSPQVNYFTMFGTTLMFPVQYKETDTKYYLGQVLVNQSGTNLEGKYTKLEVPFKPNFFFQHGNGIVNITPPKWDGTECSVDVYMNNKQDKNGKYINYFKDICSFKLSEKCASLVGVIKVDSIPGHEFIILAYRMVDTKTTTNKYEIKYEIFMMPEFATYDKNSLVWKKSSNIMTSYDASSIINDDQYVLYYGDLTARGDADFIAFSNWYIGGYPQYKTASSTFSTNTDTSINSNKYGLCLIANNLSHSDSKWKSMFFPFKINGSNVEFDTGVDTFLKIPDGLVDDPRITGNAYIDDNDDYSTLRMVVYDCFTQDKANSKTRSGWITPVMYTGAEGQWGNMKSRGTNPNMSIWAANYAVSEIKNSNTALLANTIKQEDGSSLNIPPLIGIIMGLPPVPPYTWWYWNQPGRGSWWGKHLSLSYGNSKSTSHGKSDSHSFSESLTAQVSYGVPKVFSITMSSTLSAEQDFSSSSSKSISTSDSLTWDPTDANGNAQIGWAIFLNNKMNKRYFTITTPGNDSIKIGDVFYKNLQKIMLGAIASTSYEISAFDMTNPQNSDDPKIQHLFQDFSSKMGIGVKSKFGSNNPELWSTFGENIISNWAASGCDIYAASQKFSNTAGISDNITLSNASGNSSSYTYSISATVSATEGDPLGGLSGSESVTGGWSHVNTFSTNYSKSFDFGMTYDTGCGDDAFPHISGDMKVFMPTNKTDILECTWITQNMRESSCLPWIVVYDNVTWSPTTDAGGNPIPIPTPLVNQGNPQAGQIYNNLTVASVLPVDAVKANNSLQLAMLKPSVADQWNTNTYELILTYGLDSSKKNVFCYITPDGVYNSINKDDKSNQTVLYGKSSDENNFATSLALANRESKYSINFKGGTSAVDIEFYNLPSKNILVFYNKDFYTLSNSGVIKYIIPESLGFTTINTVLEVNNTLYIGTDKGLFTGTSLDKLTKLTSFGDDSITSLSSYNDILTVSYTKDNEPGMQKVYINGNSVIKNNISLGGGLNSANGTKYGQIKYTPFGLGAFNSSNLYLCLVSQSGANSGNLCLYLAAEDYLCNSKQARDSSGGDELKNDLIELKLPLKKISGINITSNKQFSAIVSESIYKSNPAQFSFTLNNSDKQNVRFYRFNNNTQMLVQIGIEGSGTLTTYLIQGGYVANQVIYTNLEDFPPLLESNIIYKDNILYVTSADKYNINAYAYSSMSDSYILLGTVYNSANKITSIDSNPSNKDQFVINYSGSISSVDIGYVQANFNDRINAHGNWKFVITPSEGIVQLDTSETISTVNNNPYVCFPVSSIDSPYKESGTDSTNPSITNYPEAVSYLNAYLTNINEPKPELYSVYYQQNYNNTDFLGLFYNTIIPSTINNDGFFSNIYYTNTITTSTGTSSTQNNKLLLSQGTINAFFINNVYLYVNYKNINESIVYVYKISTEDFKPSGLVNIIDTQITTGVQTNLLNFNTGSNPSSNQWAIVSGNNSNHFTFTTPKTKNLLVGMALPQIIVNDNQSTPVISITTVNLNTKAITLSSDTTLPKEFIVQNAIPIKPDSKNKRGNYVDTFDTMYLVLTTDGSLIVTSSYNFSLKSSLINYGSNSTTKCTSIEYTEGDSYIKVAIGTQSDIQFTSTLTPSGENVRFVLGTNNFNMGEEGNLEKDYMSSLNITYQMNGKSISKTIIAKDKVSIEGSMLSAYLTSKGNVFISNTTRTSWQPVYLIENCTQITYDEHLKILHITDSNSKIHNLYLTKTSKTLKEESGNVDYVKTPFSPNGYTKYGHYYQFMPCTYLETEHKEGTTETVIVDMIAPYQLFYYCSVNDKFVNGIYPGFITESPLYGNELTTISSGTTLKLNDSTTGETFLQPIVDGIVGTKVYLLNDGHLYTASQNTINSFTADNWLTCPTTILSSTNWPFIIADGQYIVPDYTLTYQSQTGTLYAYINELYKYGLENGDYIYYDPITKQKIMGSTDILTLTGTNSQGTSYSGSLFSIGLNFMVYKLNNGQYAYVDIKTKKVIISPKILDLSATIAYNGKTYTGTLNSIQNSVPIYLFNQNKYAYKNASNGHISILPDNIDVNDISTVETNILGQTVITFSNGNVSANCGRTSKYIPLNPYQIGGYTFQDSNGDEKTIEVAQVLDVNGLYIYRTNSGAVWAQELIYDNTTTPINIITDGSATLLTYIKNLQIIECGGDLSKWDNILALNHQSFENSFATMIMNKSGQNNTTTLATKDYTDISLFTTLDYENIFLVENSPTIPLVFGGTEEPYYMQLNNVSNWGSSILTKDNQALLITKGNSSSASTKCYFNGTLTDICDTQLSPNKPKKGSIEYGTKPKPKTFSTINMFYTQYNGNPAWYYTYAYVIDNDFYIKTGWMKEGILIGTLPPELYKARLVRKPFSYMRIYKMNDDINTAFYKFYYTGKDSDRLSSQYDFSSYEPFSFRLVDMNLDYDGDMSIVSIKRGRFYDILACYNGKIQTIIKNSLYDLSMNPPMGDGYNPTNPYDGYTFTCGLLVDGFNYFRIGLSSDNSSILLGDKIIPLK